MTPSLLRGLQIFLLALGVLSLEISLTRVFSFLMFHHLTYLVIGVALLGFGAAGTYLTTRTPRDDDDTEFVGRQAFRFGLAAIAAITIIPRIHFYMEDMYRHGDWSNLVSLLLMIVLAGLPFFFSGAGIGYLISRAGENVNVMYFADLLGAAAGALLAVGSLNWLGATATCIAVGALGIFVAAISSRSARRGYGFLFVAAAALALFIAKTEWLTMYAPPDKPLYRRHNQVELITWHPIARLDVTVPVQRHHSFGGALSPQYEGPPPTTRLVFQDGGALTGIIQPNDTPEETEVLGHYMQGAASYLRPGADVLVIGCGGGVDVEIALHHGARHVVAVDVNPKIVELLRGHYSEFARGVFQRDDVELVASEGRHHLTRSDRKFDVIQLSGVDTYTALAAGAYAITENFIYTVEAIEQYLDHLKPNGIVSITRPLIRPPRETLKLAITCVEVLRSRGIPRPEQHLVILSGRGQGSFFAVPWGQTMIKNTPFTREEVARLESWAAARGFRLAWAPFGQGGGVLGEFLRSSPAEQQKTIADDPRFLEPATDDRPFFFHFYPWERLLTLGIGSSDAPPLSIAVIFVLATFAQVTVLSAVFILWPLFRRGFGGDAREKRFATFFYFATLGLGFIFIEIALMQKFTVFLGGPAYSMAVTLFAVLLSSGLGSLASRRFAQDPLRLITVVVPLLALLTAVASLTLGGIAQNLFGLSHVARIATVIVLVFPLGFLMGMPFPAGLLIVNRERAALTPWAWGINACATVMGTVLTAMLSTAYGFSHVMRIGAVVYVLGWFVFWVAERRPGRAPAG